MSDENKVSSPGQQPEYESPCPECHAGVYHLEYLTYFTWLNDELITVPNFPSWVCDVCGRREYDSRAISWLNTLLSSEGGRKPRLQRRGRHNRLDRPQPQ